MESSVSSCSPTNSPSSSEDVGRGMDYDVFVQQMSGADPYAPGYAPTAPNSSPAVDSVLPIPDGPDVQATFGFYPIEVLVGSNPLEFIVYYPYPWDPSPPESWEEWSMVIVASRFLDHITWYEGEWHLVWGEFTGPTYLQIV